MKEPDHDANQLDRLNAPAEKVKGLSVGLILGSCLAGAGLVLFWWFSSEVFEGETAVFDEGVRSFLRQFASEPLTRLMVCVSMLGSPVFVSVLGVATAVILIFRKWTRGLILIIATMAGGLILNLLLKALYQRARPEAFPGYELPASFSFPSGHALGSFCFYGMLAWLITRGTKNRALARGVWAMAGTLVLFIGLSRIYLGVHYPSDVLAGYFVASIWTISVTLGDAWYRGRKMAKREKD